MARIRYALRSLAKAPLLSLVVILSLALGIGANTAIFSLLHQMVLSSLPVQKPEELVLVTSPGEFKSGRSSSERFRRQGLHLQLPGVPRAGEELAGAGRARRHSATSARNLSFGKQTVAGRFRCRLRAVFPDSRRAAADRAHDRAGGRRGPAAAIPSRCSATATGTTSSAARPTC